MENPKDFTVNNGVWKVKHDKVQKFRDDISNWLNDPDQNAIILSYDEPVSPEFFCPKLDLSTDFKYYHHYERLAENKVFFNNVYRQQISSFIKPKRNVKVMLKCYYSLARMKVNRIFVKQFKTKR